MLCRQNTEKYANISIKSQGQVKLKTKKFNPQLLQSFTLLSVISGVGTEYFPSKKGSNCLSKTVAAAVKATESPCCWRAMLSASNMRIEDTTLLERSSCSPNTSVVRSRSSCGFLIHHRSFSILHSTRPRYKGKKNKWTKLKQWSKQINKHPLWKGKRDNESQFPAERKQNDESNPLRKEKQNDESDTPPSGKESRIIIIMMNQII